ncbi:MAG TPA: glycoside hydrolase family 125 protein [Terracidiphilus sp.]|nr:glycoside hydrolase family 125 protein [Terracidiphilus sp.]
MNRREFAAGSAAMISAQFVSVQLASHPFTGLSGRPSVADRCFRSPIVEHTIAEMRAATSSPELARIFEHCFPNTLDTTVFPGSFQGKPDTYVITGDIDAMWLRDSAAQVWPYLPFAKDDAALRRLLEGVIRRHARLIQIDSYANAFTRNPSDPPLRWATHDKTKMHRGVAERKWEIDSLCYPVRLAHHFWQVTGSHAPFDNDWFKAAARIVTTFREQQRIKDQGPYHFERSTAKPSDTLPMNGYGNPIRPNGLICSGFRPSDDACIYPFFIPANLFAALTLERIAEIATEIYHDQALAQECVSFAQQVRAAVEQHGIVHHATYGDILAYEVDGYGNTLSMDDANAPGLLSIAYLELLKQDDPLYQRSRAFALSLDNPYFFRGRAGEGLGGPHIGRDYIWPMSILMRALTSDSDAEITDCLQTLCATTAGTYYMHESFQKDDPSRYTRPWFAWANGLFGELLLKLRQERPALLRDFRARS